MKGTFSELELSILRQRSQEALRLKAARGDLHTSVAVGYVRSANDRLELDPDKRVREALHLAFRKFAEFGSVRQSPFGCAMKASRCRLLSTVRAAEWSNGGCLATIRSIGC
jgi:DNA invertase Pin-like site-specific DNA recombinase